MNAPRQRAASGGPRLVPFLLATLLSASLLGSGCAVVQPWERDALARRDMAWSPDPLASQLDDHIRFSKEGSLPAGGGGGGGCGCN